MPAFTELAGRPRPRGEALVNDYVLRFRKAPYELTVFRDGRTIVKGTGDGTRVTSPMARHVGV